MSDPNEWHIACDRDGFFIEDEYGEEILPSWLNMFYCVFAGLWQSNERPDPPLKRRAGT
jgi:hypothetical protein